MSEGKNVPKIRFPGFDGEWDFCKLSNLLSLSNERNDGDYSTNDVLAASLGTELEKKHLFFGLKATEESVKNYRIVRNGDVIFTKSPIKGFPNGIVRANKGEDGIVPSLYCVYHSNNIVNPAFIQAYFEDKSRLDEYLFPLVNTGARNNVNITDKGFLEGVVCIPSIEEQKKTVELLESLANQIVLIQQNLDKWKELKKGMLQKMFPKEGESVPENRFPGFKIVWGQKRLADMSDFITKGATPTTYGYEWVESGIPFFRNDSIKDNIFTYGDYSFITEEAHNALNRSEIQSDDILVAITGEIGKVGIVPKSIKKGNINQHLARIRLKDGSVPYFVYQSLCTEEQQNKYRAIKTGISMAQLSLEQIRDTIIPFPDQEEQKRIGTFFERIDRLIYLHQHELDKWKELKKGLLQQMIV